MWGRDRAELYYLDGTTAMTALPVTITNGAFTAGHAQKLFDARGYSTDGTRAYDVAADGSRFIFVKAPRPPGHLVVVLNWFAEVKEKLRERR
jgi:hypothetical protein